MSAVSRYAILAAAVAALFTASCIFSDPEPPTAEPAAPVNTSPANCLKVVVQSWNKQDYAQFRPTLSPNFVFYFNPLDVGKDVGGYIIPVSWNRVEMEEAVQKMFNEAYSITVSIPTAEVGAPGDEDTIWRAENVNIRLELLTSPGNGYRIGSGYCNFEFEKYEENGENRWRLTKWWDFTRGGRDNGESPPSFGTILAIYH